MATSVKQMLEAAHAAVPKITPAQAKEMIAKGNTLVVDVRDGTEVAASGKVAGAVHVSRGMLEFRADPELPSHDKNFAKDKDVILYCGSGGRAALAGKLQWHGNKVDPTAIRRTMLLTVEGERDDICAVGQTVAAHDLCSKLRPYLKRHHMQAGVGHYGVFSGKRWENQIYPILKNVILSSD